MNSIIPVNQNEGHVLKEYVEAVMRIQPNWDDTNTSKMQERGIIIRTKIPQILRPLLRNITNQYAFDLSVEGRDGTGRKTRVPWVRIYSPEHSPSATSGWFLLYIFASDGSSVFLSLNQGTTNFKGGVLLPKPSWVLSIRRGSRHGDEVDRWPKSQTQVDGR